MKKLIKLFKLVVLLMFFSACATESWIAPPFTEIDRMLSVKTGMTVDQVNRQLGIAPFDIYILDEEHTSILVYHYVKKARKAQEPVGNLERLKRSKEGLTKGEEYYLSGQPQRLFVQFKDGLVTSMITDAGIDNAQWIALTQNGLKVISNEQRACHPCTSEDQFSSSLVKINNSKPAIIEDNAAKSKKSKAGIWFLGSILLIAGVISLGAVA